MPLQPSILAVGKVMYSVTVLAQYQKAETRLELCFFHLIVRAIGADEAGDIAAKRVGELLAEGNAVDGMTGLSAIAIMPGRHPNLFDQCQSIGDEDDGTDKSSEDFPLHMADRDDR